MSSSTNGKFNIWFIYFRDFKVGFYAHLGLTEINLEADWFSRCPNKVEIDADVYFV